MAINKFMKAALKAMSYADFDYKTERDIKNIVSKNPMNGLRRDLTKTLENGGRKVPVAVYYPDRTLSNEILLFFHGGGWVSGSVDGYARTCKLLADMTGRRVVSAEYSLAPEFPFPHALEDCYTVARELHIEDTFFEVEPDSVIIIGDSAGANLAASVSLMARERGDFKVKKQILIYPAVQSDYSEDSPFPSVIENGTDYLLTAKRMRDYMEKYASSPEDLKNPYLAPLYAEDLSDQPQTLIITAEFDPLRDEGEAYGEKLKQFGNHVEIHRIKDALHGFFSLPKTYAHVKKAYEIINCFLNGGSTEKDCDNERQMD